MRQISSMPDCAAAAEATFNTRLYKPEKEGKVYLQLRRNDEVYNSIAYLPADEEIDYINLKFGRTGDIERRRGEYERDCKGEEIVWGYYYHTKHVKLLERLVHLSLEAAGAKRKPYPCSGCGKRHREHFSEEAAAAWPDSQRYPARLPRLPASDDPISPTSDSPPPSPGSPNRYPAPENSPLHSPAPNQYPDCRPPPPLHPLAPPPISGTVNAAPSPPPNSPDRYSAPISAPELRRPRPRTPNPRPRPSPRLGPPSTSPPRAPSSPYSPPSYAAPAPALRTRVRARPHAWAHHPHHPPRAPSSPYSHKETTLHSAASATPTATHEAHLAPASTSPDFRPRACRLPPHSELAPAPTLRPPLTMRSPRDRATLHHNVPRGIVPSTPRYFIACVTREVLAVQECW
ncbi:hypothetical protein B0H11DRAFT_2230020 [Mycena galericulata]|nr:hypothetical protein B0H11DRAFT_2230020 [Mycena galericulata]